MVQLSATLYRYFVSQSNEFCRHNTLCPMAGLGSGGVETSRSAARELASESINQSVSPVSHRVVMHINTILRRSYLHTCSAISWLSTDRHIELKWMSFVFCLPKGGRHLLNLMLVVVISEFRLNIY